MVLSSAIEERVVESTAGRRAFGGARRPWRSR